MTEQHRAYWNETQADGFQLVYKRYEPKVDRIAAVYFRHPAYRAVIYEKASEELGGPSKWVERKPAALSQSLVGAIESTERMLTEPPRHTNLIVDLPPAFDATDGRGVRYIKGNNVIPAWTGIVGHFLLASIAFLISRGTGDLDEIFGGTHRKIRLRKTLLKLKAIDLVAAQFGVSAEDVRRIADSKRIMPQININGMDYYNPNDFGDMTTLLQPASAPSNGVLLQPISHSTTNDETLLRSSISSKDES